MTIMAMVEARLRTRNFMTFSQILAELREEKPDLTSYTLSPILSKMQRNGIIYKHLGAWQMSPIAPTRLMSS